MKKTKRKRGGGFLKETWTIKVDPCVLEKAKKIHQKKLPKMIQEYLKKLSINEIQQDMGDAR